MTAVRKNTPKSHIEWLSLNQAARELGISRLKLLTMTLRGDLIHGFVGKNPVIARESVERIVRDSEAGAGST
jgi:hypothetical protein